MVCPLFTRADAAGSKKGAKNRKIRSKYLSRSEREEAVRRANKLAAHIWPDGLKAAVRDQ